MKICLFGSTGLLGSEFKSQLKNTSFELITPKRLEVQLLNFASVIQFLEREKPDLIINCAAYTHVDRAEGDKDNCFALNVDAVRNITKSGIPMIHFSTDYVFNAPKNIEIPEDYSLDPQSIYGRSKAQAEEVLEVSDILWWNIRTSWLFGPGGKNFVSTILKLSKNKTALSIINDQIGRPTYAPDLAEFIIENFIKKKQPIGHYHLQNTGDPVSWADFAAYFLKLKHWKGTIKRVDSQTFGAEAERPLNSVLKNTKLPQMQDWKDTVKVFLKIKC